MIYIATHKKYVMPPFDGYQPILVGAARHSELPSGYMSDATGKNISLKNSNFSEVTAIYWIRYNTDDEVVGLMHYRRYLGLKKSHRLEDILQNQQINHLLSKYDIILPKKRNYIIENQKDHYLHAHSTEPYVIMKQVITTKYVEYLPAFEQMESSTSAHLFNMFIMPRNLFDDYADFLFGVLEEVEKNIDIEKLEGQEVRVYGFLSERLMDTWVNTKRLSVAECPVIGLERTNWLDKGYNFLKRKFFPKSKKKVHF
ncbi:exopolysaccharide biosynthesis protein [Leuconostoc pseudomesenteroides]|jgi:hypothetical protein|uniref:DUF4422 domain-containing protein n=1 Tax=Leuconostoc falkenbergense TaxID=2766470 RepID=A0A9X3IPG2_9LACO|nr:DUF4422 domain-containing protein [Leuconostoc falkenbergense]RDG19622.1 exopolysaccharide biosynthesis protein [Leuconostoc pseudomesenteroides]MCT4389349.1 DUF4422 domain-containing protein [Leuconostoc falkenbergense]MCT4410526.1 DUF4422 domain-containing protein [Leuconostoc falkenbergense]MCX7579369.1 DUF4422 domain-containing protein [Leuconostoc falkenbergense]MDV3544971.1 DUF4422 domain-containing protein [Leuconostoc falkenbergense]